MWKLKSITLLDGSMPEGPVLSRDVLAQHQNAQEILARAHERAEAIISAAREQAEAELAQQRLHAEAQFWQQADELLSDWHQQRQQDESQLIQLADRLLNEALQQLLDDTGEEKRFHALLRQLLRHHPRQQSATLYCALDREQAISAWLAQQPQLRWTLCGDDLLEPDTLRLVTDRGELVVSWSALCAQLTRESEGAL
ncbi:type III secretion system stator protein SctL [Siccibacter colletis]|uniref:Type III secretion system stator protein SctL n=1 Tax=Siccibacter colletis TaxID=1505757 RepID=A0ABY6JIQ1_9ENTR|nr:type III secretion system stator protein SctL [Siccibacter colletis]UYU33700.1 type III secretion system stator protein SctL [Siccibacter colletis]